MSDRSAHNDAENTPTDRPAWLLGDHDDAPAQHPDLIEPKASSHPGIFAADAPAPRRPESKHEDEIAAPAHFDTGADQAVDHSVDSDSDWQWAGSSETLRTDDTTGIIGHVKVADEVEPVTTNAYKATSQDLHSHDLDAVADPEESFDSAPSPGTPEFTHESAASPATQEPTASDFGADAQPFDSADAPDDVLANRQGPDRNYQPRRDYDLSRLRTDETAAEATPQAHWDYQDAATNQPAADAPAQTSGTGLAAAGALLEDDLESTSIRRQSLLHQPQEDEPAANNASWRPRQDDVTANEVESSLFADSTVIPEVPSRTGARLWSLLLTLVLAPVTWYLLTDAAARLTLARNNPWDTGVVNIAALGELAAGVVALIVVVAMLARSSLGALVWGFVIAVGGGVFLAVPKLTATYLEPAQQWLRSWNSFGQNVAHHLEWTGSTGAICVAGLTLFTFGIVAILARRDGKREYQIRDQIERMAPGTISGKRRG